MENTTNSHKTKRLNESSLILYKESALFSLDLQGECLRLQISFRDQSKANIFLMICMHYSGDFGCDFLWGLVEDSLTI